MKGILIVTVGIPGSGKTSWVKDYIEENKDKNIEVISSDEIRKELLNDIKDQSKNKEIFDIMKERTKRSLSNGHITIYEATNISSKRRRALLKEMKKYYSKAICLFKYKNLIDCIIDNDTRSKRVPDEVIERMYKNIEIPHKCEGFDEVIIDYDIGRKLYINNRRKNNLGMDKERFIECNNYKEYIDLLIELGLSSCVEMSQDSKWHNLSLSKHMYFCYKKIKEVDKLDKNLLIASMLHDISKPIAKTEDKENRYCHYYNHENMSAYDVINILIKYTKFCDRDIMDIAWLINNHMIFKNGYSSEKLVRKIGYLNYARLLALHNADNSAK
jgi:predicted kinase